MRTIGIIPARYSSTRLKGKPLIDIAGKPMIQHVYERASSAAALHRVIVATDDMRIVQAVEAFGGEVRLTSPDHPSGTDRVAEVAASVEADIVVNIQGDEPLVTPEMIADSILPLQEDHDLQMSTLCRRILDVQELFDPDVVKVVRDRQGFALYFSRAPIPYHRDEWKEKDQAPGGGSGLSTACYRHFGLYAYRRDFLFRLTALPPSPLEKTERLEQLRALENGYRIKVVETQADTIGVDTELDLERVRELFRHRGWK